MGQAFSMGGFLDIHCEWRLLPDIDGLNLKILSHVALHWN